MWRKGNEIKIDKIDDRGILLVRYTCPHCNKENDGVFYGLSKELFKLKPYTVGDFDRIKCLKCHVEIDYDIEFKTDTDTVEILLDSYKIDEKNKMAEVEEGILTSYNYNYNDAPKQVAKFHFSQQYHLQAVLDFYGQYRESIKELKDLLKKKYVKHNMLLLRLVFSNVITAFETYLYDLLLHRILRSEKYLRAAVESANILDGVRDFTKINIKDIYKTIDALKEQVVKRLQNTVFHNLEIVIPLYKNILDIDFSSKLGDLSDAISYRHDIVHRNGADKSGRKMSLDTEYIKNLIKTVNEIVDYIEEQ